MRIIILTADGMEDSEVLYPYYRFQEQQISVDIATPDGKEVVGKHGYRLPASKALDQVRADDYDALFLPGGKAPETVRLNANAVAVVRDMVKAGKPVGSICHGAQVLISAQVLKGRKATCWQGIRDDLQAAGAQYSDAEVVVDGNLVSSRMPTDLPTFCREFLRVAAAAQQQQQQRAA